MTRLRTHNRRRLRSAKRWANLRALVMNHASFRLDDGERRWWPVADPTPRPTHYRQHKVELVPQGHGGFTGPSIQELIDEGHLVAPDFRAHVTNPKIVLEPKPKSGRGVLLVDGKPFRGVGWAPKPAPFCYELGAIQGIETGGSVVCSACHAIHDYDPGRGWGYAACQVCGVVWADGGRPRPAPETDGFPDPADPIVRDLIESGQVDLVKGKPHWCAKCGQPTDPTAGAWDRCPACGCLWATPHKPAPDPTVEMLPVPLVDIPK